MKIQYRVKQVKFPSAKTMFIVQYRLVFFIYKYKWINLKHNLTGSFFMTSSTYCESRADAINLINKSIINLNRASEWWRKKSLITDIYPTLIV